MNSFINMKGCSSNNIKQKFDSITKKPSFTLIASISLRNFGLISNEEMHA